MLLFLCRAAATQPDPPHPWLLPAHPLQLCSVSLVAFFSLNRPFKDLGAQDLPVRISLQLRLHHSQELPLVLACLRGASAHWDGDVGMPRLPPAGDLDVPHTGAVNLPVGTPASSHLNS